MRGNASRPRAGEIPERFPVVRDSNETSRAPGREPASQSPRRCAFPIGPGRSGRTCERPSGHRQTGRMTHSKLLVPFLVQFVAIGAVAFLRAPVRVPDHQRVTDEPRQKGSDERQGHAVGAQDVPAQFVPDGVVGKQLEPEHRGGAPFRRRRHGADRRRPRSTTHGKHLYCQSSGAWRLVGGEITLLSVRRDLARVLSSAGLARYAYGGGNPATEKCRSGTTSDEPGVLSNTMEKARRGRTPSPGRNSRWYRWTTFT